MLELKKITLTSDDMKECIALDIAPEQEDFVQHNAYVLAEAYEWNLKGIVWECRGIYHENKVIGLISYNYYVDDPVYKEPCYRIRPFMVDKNRLGNGYEEKALQLLAEEIRTKPLGEAAAIIATYNLKEEDMAEVYKSAGFVETRMDWADEDPNYNSIIMRMGL